VRSVDRNGLFLGRVVCGGLLVLPFSLPAWGQIAIRNQGFVPFSDAPINYRSEVHDPIAELQKRLDRGEVTLDYEPQHGYLKSVLEKLAVPVSSQTLVFSKTSFQYKKISPKTPRALYFNDDVYVGQVHDGKVLEFVSFDAMQGAIFYILDEHRADKPKFERAELDCTQCHVAAGTRNVPGVLLRSIFTTSTGNQAAHTHAYIISQQSPLDERFGGWYVTGVSGRQLHMGNVTAEDDDNPEELDRAAGVNVTDLSKWFNVSSYLTPHSDIVAQLVLAHQTQAHNLITLTNYQTRLALYAEAQKNKGAAVAPDKISDAARKQFERPAEELVRYLLFTDEAPLTDPVKGDSDFAEEFAARGPRDSKGRSLRDFDLHTRLFKYPCSYLIYSADFDALPSPAKEYVYRRLFEVLTGREQGPEFAKLTGEDRRAILEILVATKPGLPSEWKEYIEGKTYAGWKKNSTQAN
jgi:hypothetical protein